MSYQAMNWAAAICTGVPSRKAVLLMLANVADDEGYVRFVRVQKLMDWTELGRASVYLRLAEIEDAGLLERDHARADGKVVVHGQLRFDVTGWPEAAQTAEIQNDEGSGEGGESNGLDWDESNGLDSTQGDESNGLDSGESNRLDSPLYRNLSIKESPTTTSFSSCPREEAAEEQAEGASPQISESAETETPLRRDWRAFQSAYPFDSTMRLDRAFDQFENLTGGERAKAIRFAEILKRECAARGRKHPMDAANWLKKREWDRPAPLSAAANDGLVFVKRGTRMWSAWESFAKTPEYVRVARRLNRAPVWPPFVSRSPDGVGDGAHFPSNFPPGVDPPAVEF